MILTLDIFIRALYAQAVENHYLDVHYVFCTWVRLLTSLDRQLSRTIPTKVK